MTEPISIIIIADNYASALEKNLPGVLAQQYEPGFEVVVVRESKKGESADVLNPLMETNPNLHSTYIPDIPQYITDAEVAIMLGTKAAKNERIVVVHPKFETPSENWLSELADNLTDSLTTGTPYYHHKTSFIKKFKHRKECRSLLSKWCKQKGLRRSETMMQKLLRKNLAISYSREEYINDPELRYFIFRFLNP